MSRVLRRADLSDPVIATGFVLDAVEADFRTLFTGTAGAYAAGDAAARAGAPDEAGVPDGASADYRRGFDDGHEAAACALRQQAAQLRALAQSLTLLRGAPESTLATIMFDAVERLLREAIGVCPANLEMLRVRAQEIAKLMTAEMEPAALCVNPDDVAIFDGIELSVPIRPDDSVAAGHLRLDTAHGWIEDGPGVRLERLRAMLDRPEEGAS